MYERRKNSPRNLYCYGTVFVRIALVSYKENEDYDFISINRRYCLPSRGCSSDLNVMLPPECREMLRRRSVSIESQTVFSLDKWTVLYQCQMSSLLADPIENGERLFHFRGFSRGPSKLGQIVNNDRLSILRGVHFV